MFNMAVLNLKDILKYFLKFIITIFIIMELIKIFNVNSQKLKIKDVKVNNNSLLECLNLTIPAISKISKKEENEKEAKKPLKEIAMRAELEMFSSQKTPIKTEKLQDESKEEVNQVKEEIKTKENDEIIKASTGQKTEIIPSNVPSRYTNEYKGVQIRNETKYNLTEEILTPNISVNKDKILLFHTHTCESYTQSEKYQYIPTGNYRTTNRDFSVVRVGRELDKQLSSYGYNVIHNEEYHDYPSYTGSYSNSLKTVNSILREKGNENIDVVMDIHRDAVGDNKYAPSVKIGDECVSQIMFVIGGNGSNIRHDEWQQNLKFAVKVQQKANEMYPGLFRPIMLRYSGYNQHVAKAAVLIEVGATGNTLDQSIASMKYLARVMSEVLK